MAEKAEDHRNNRHDSRREIGSTLRALQMAPKDRNQYRKTRQADQHAAPVDSEAPQPFDEVIPARAKHEPLVSQKRHCYCDDVRQRRRIHVAVRDQPRKQPIEQRKQAISEDGVKPAHQNVASKLVQRLVRSCFHAESRLLEVYALFLCNQRTIQHQGVNGADVLPDNAQRDQLH